MIKSTLPNNHAYTRSASPTPKQAETTQVKGHDIDDDDFGWGDFFSGVVGGVAGAAIQGVGNTVSSVGRTAQALVYDGENVLPVHSKLWKENMIGPWLKATLTPVLFAAAPLVPVLTAVGSLGYGFYAGAIRAAEDGIGESISESFKDVGRFHNELAGKAIEELREYQSQPLEEGEEPFDISPIKGVESLAAGTVTTVMGGVGGAAVTLRHLPGGALQLAGEIAEADVNLPAKAALGVGLVVGTALAVPLAGVAGALGGLGFGVYQAYNEGFGSAVGETGKYIGEYNKMIKEAREEMRD